jgi:regulator of sigma E protease
MILAIILVVVLFSLLVIVHELGHFVVARMSGVEVQEFGVGFPPQAWARKIGRTLYSVNWLPLGGFVRMRGEDGGDQSPGSFGGASLRAKTAILLAGVGMNALTAYMLILVLCIWGLPAAFATSFNLPQPAASSPQRVLVLEIAKDSPAATSGLEKGDKLLSANGQQLASEQQLVDFTHDHAGTTASFEVEHGGATTTKQIKLRDPEAGKDSGYLGVTPLAVQNLAFGWRAPIVAASLLGQMIWGTLAGFATTIAGLFHHQQGGAAVAVAGPVGIVVIMTNALYLGAGYVIFFLATISVSLAILNALPIPALDGGRLALIWFGKLRRKPVSPELEAKIHTVGFALLLLLMAIVTVIDLRRL